MHKESSLKFIVASVIAVVGFIFCTAGITYSFFRIPVNGDLTESKVKSSTFGFETNVDSASGINSRLYLLNEDEVAAKADTIDFYVKANVSGTNNGKYDIFLTDVAISKNLISEDLKYDVIKDGSVIESGDFSDINTTGVASTTANTETTNYYSAFYLKKEIPITGNDTSNISIRVYLLNDSTKDQSSLMNGNLSCKASVEAYK